MRLAPLYEQDRELAIQQAEQKEALKLVLRLINRRLGEITDKITETIQTLPVEQLENLGEALLDFDNQTDLMNWLNNNH